MMTSFYNLLKYAQTGIAAPDMTYYDKMRASTLMGGGTVQTLTGQPPLTFKADGKPLISWSMKGNGSQSGTPTPDNPVMPEFVGTKTAQMYDIDGKNTANGYVNNTQLYADGSTEYWLNGEISEYITVDGDTQYTLTNMGSYNSPAYCFYDADKQYISGSGFGGRSKITFTTPSNCKYVRITHVKTQPKTMLNLGSTAISFEPFGYKIPITCAGQTVPVYLGQVQTVRRVRKLVLDGTEFVYVYASADIAFRINMADTLRNYRYCMCTHFTYQNTPGYSVIDGVTAGADDTNLYFTLSASSAAAVGVVARDTNSFKSYLAAQYAAGTPVTVWYVLAEPETAIVNEPLCKIGTYADELHSEDAGVSIPTVKGQNTLTVDTDLQPSEMTITYLG